MRTLKKTSYYLVVIIVLGVAVISFWIYGRYFKANVPNLLPFTVQRGDIKEVIHARGEAAPHKEFDMEFPFSGTVERVFVNEGDVARRGTPLIKLETIDYALEKKSLLAELKEREANLAKLVAGPTVEDMQVSKTKVANAKTALEDARNNVVDKLRDAFVKSDDAIRNRADQFFSNPRTSNPNINLIVDTQAETTLEFQRFSIERMLLSWENTLADLTVSSDLKTRIAGVKGYLTQQQEFLDALAAEVNELGSATEKEDIFTARKNINAASSNIVASEEKLRTEESNLELAERELALKSAGTRDEDLAIARAQIKQTKSRIAKEEENIRKSTLYAPAEVLVKDILLEEGEIFRTGAPVISLATTGYKIESDISELDIGKITPGDGARVVAEFDAFPGVTFEGSVISIDPGEVVKDEDKYYRANIAITAGEQEIRSGMSADLTIFTIDKQGVLKVPEFMVKEKNGKWFVTVREGERTRDVEVETGISDGEFIEIVKGLNEGDEIIVAEE